MPSADRWMAMIFWVLSLGIVIQRVVATYKIIMDLDKSSYTVLAEYHVRTITECSMKCDANVNCTSIFISNGDSDTEKCLLIQEPGNSTSKEVVDKKYLVQIIKVDDDVFFESQLKDLPTPTIQAYWSKWSDYSKCNRKCGGGEQRRNRTCLNPHPRSGGTNCCGEAEERRVCNSRPCLVCEATETPLNHPGRGKSQYLDRHNLSCEGHSVITKFQLNFEGKQMNYRYNCCKEAWNCVTAIEETDYDLGGKAKYLDKLTVKCSSGLISMFKVQVKPGYFNMIRYRYECCNLDMTLECYDEMTTPTVVGDSTSALANLDVKCMNGSYGIQSFRLTRLNGANFVYKYKCCK